MAAIVPRFFFHIHDDIELLDDEGIELPDREAAEREALRGARSIACEQVVRGELHLEHRIDVEGEDGETLFRVRFGDAIDVGP